MQTYEKRKEIKNNKELLLKANKNGKTLKYQSPTMTQNKKNPNKRQE